MTTEEVIQKQKLAVELYNMANGHIEFKSFKDNIEEITENLKDLSEGEHVVVLDLNE
jgi:hypothetical protein